MKIPAAKPWFDEQDRSSIARDISAVLESGVLVLGPYTRAFEEAFSAYCGVKHAVAVSTCTAALEISLRYIDIQGREVIVPTNTFVATANAVLENGGKLVLADMRQDTLCIDPEEIKRRVTPETKAVIVVHIAGLPCPDIGEIQDICRQNDLMLLEDCAHAHGAMIDWRKTGSLGLAGCFSFYPTKVMTTGTGGMITTDDNNLDEYARCLRCFGAGGNLNHVTHMGNDWLMTEISAVLGIHQLRKLESSLEARNRIARTYYEMLDGSPYVEIPDLPANIRHSYYKIPVLLSPEIDKRRLVKHMKDRYSVDLGSVYDPPVHLQPVYRTLHGYRPGMFAAAESILPRTCCLPVYPQMTEGEIGYVAGSLLEALPVCAAEAVIS